MHAVCDSTLSASEKIAVPPVMTLTWSCRRLPTDFQVFLGQLRAKPIRLRTKKYPQFRSSTRRQTYRRSSDEASEVIDRLCSMLRRRNSSGNLADKYGRGRTKRASRCRTLLIGLLMIAGGSVVGDLWPEIPLCHVGFKSQARRRCRFLQKPCGPSETDTTSANRQNSVPWHTFAGATWHSGGGVRTIMLCHVGLRSGIPKAAVYSVVLQHCFSSASTSGAPESEVPPTARFADGGACLPCTGIMAGNAVMKRSPKRHPAGGLR